MTNPIDLLSDEYRTLVETANLDWLVAEYVRYDRLRHEHSANEIKAAAIRAFATREHGEAFASAVEHY